MDIVFAIEIYTNLVNEGCIGSRVRLALDFSSDFDINAGQKIADRI